jgi:procollagen-lysine,2-oxoglutarate 5-dioxygenase
MDFCNENNELTGDKLYYITVATKPHPVLDRIKQQVKQNGEQIIVLGENENRYIGWQANQNFGIKLREVRNFLQKPELNPNDVILFTDAYDVAYSGNITEIARRFYYYTKPIIFGGETQCSPDPEKASFYSNTTYEFSYLNSGMFIGRVWALRQCIISYEFNDNDDDQRYWTSKFLKHPELIELDYKNKLFLNTVDIDMSRFSWNGKVGWYKLNSPIFIHVNGPDKSLIDTLVQY